MRITEWKNGILIEREATEKELAVIEADAVTERKRPLTESEITRMIITAQINTLAVDDQAALRMKEYYPTWEDLCVQSVTADKAGYKFVYGGELYKTRQAEYTFVSHYVPGVGTESLFERIDEQHDGSKYDPILYAGNMALTAGLYYSQYGTVYRCIRDTVNPVYADLSALAEIYVEEVNNAV